MSYITYEVKVYEDGTKKWYLNDELHRIDGPAIEYSSGAKHWYLNGKLHREDGPAIEYSSGSKHWYLNGERHREDGPAIEWADEYKYWYLNGEIYCEEEFNNKMSPAIEMTIAEIEKALALGRKVKIIG
tara:strand:- start:3588 stop:3974 length:387 start_codon:yes stop_codon:yes gene_type:complete